MVKTARLFFLVFFLLFFTFPPQTMAFNLSSVFNKTFVLSKNDSVIRPQVTFGQILANEAIRITPTSSADKINKLLEALETSKRASLSEFEQNRNTNLIQRVAELVITPQPTYHPKIEQALLASEQNKLALNQKTENKEQGTKNLQPITYNLEPIIPNIQPTTNHQFLGVMSQNPIKTTYVVAVLGDSMVDTLGVNIPALKSELSRTFPDYSFAVLNFGQGSTDLENGFNRLTKASYYLGRYHSPVLSYNPDILVIESFAYNHWSDKQYDLDRQWLTYAKIKDTVNELSPQTKIIMAATIGPNPYTYGDGKLNWGKDLKWEAAQTTKIYLQNAVNFANSEKIPLANAYQASLDTNGHGLQKYINQGDHLHPSETGAALVSQKIVEAIKENRLIE